MIHRKKPLEIAWAEFLVPWKWTHAITLTTSSPWSAAAIKRELVFRYIRNLERIVQHRVIWFYASEERAHGHPHLHVLLGGTAGLATERIQHFWKAGYTRCHVIHDSRGAIEYAVKGIGRLSADFDFSVGCFRTQRLLPQDGRYLPERLIPACENGLYGLHDDEEPARSRILEAPSHHMPAASRTALCKLAGGRTTELRRAIDDLIADGSIWRSESGLLFATERDSGDGSDVRGDRPVSAASEPNREPRAPLSHPSGSQTDLPHPRETGTVSREEATVRVLI